MALPEKWYNQLYHCCVGFCWEPIITFFLFEPQWYNCNNCGDKLPNNNASNSATKLCDKISFELIVQ
jgi:hypothetical protein